MDAKRITAVKKMKNEENDENVLRGIVHGVVRQYVNDVVVLENAIEVVVEIENVKVSRKNTSIGTFLHPVTNI